MTNTPHLRNQNFLVVIDDSPESQLALRYATRRAAATQSMLGVAIIIPPQDFLPLGGAQATLEAEAREAAENLAAAATRIALAEAGIEPKITIADGEAQQVLRDMLYEQHITALILGAAAEGAPGPLVAHFTGEGCGSLPCPVVIVPGALSLDTIAEMSVVAE